MVVLFSGLVGWFGFPSLLIPFLFVCFVEKLLSCCGCVSVIYEFDCLVWYLLFVSLL